MYVIIVLYCSVLFYAAVIEFAFSVVERGMTGIERSPSDMFYHMQ
jgi:hypothetical protein